MEQKGYVHAFHTWLQVNEERLKIRRVLVQTTGEVVPGRTQADFVTDTKRAKIDVWDHGAGEIHLTDLRLPSQGYGSPVVATHQQFQSWGELFGVLDNLLDRISQGQEQASARKSYIRVFDYVEELDAFLVRPQFRELSEWLGLTEWHEVVWVGRLFTLDNDYGEHWFDNWDEREALEARAAELGIDDFNLMIINPARLADKTDGPCHLPELRKRFWTDVLQSLELSYQLLFEKARLHNQSLMEGGHGGEIMGLEERIEAIMAEATH